MYYMKPLKSPTYIHFFAKNFYRFETIFALWFWDFLHVFMRIMQSENSATDIYAHYRQSETAPHIRTLYAREISPRYIWKIVARLESVCAIDWGLVSLRSFCIMFCIWGHRLDKVVFVVDWLMSKLVVKMW